MQSKKINDLIEMASRRQKPVQCFAARLKNPAAGTFINAITKLARSGRDIVCTEAVRIFKSEWKIDVRADSVRRHLRGDCKCPK